MIIRVLLSEKKLKELDEYYRHEHGMTFRQRLQQLINIETDKASFHIEDRKELNLRGNRDNETSFIQNSQE
jgi:hypothetical protein